MTSSGMTTGFVLAALLTPLAALVSFGAAHADSRFDWATGPSIYDDPESARQWSADMTLYLWAASAEGSVSTPATGTLTGSASFASLASDLDAGFAGVVQLRWRRWNLVSDNSWIQLSSSRALSGPANLAAGLELTDAFGTTAVAYELPLGGGTAVDLVLGARWWYMRTDVRLYSIASQIGSASSSSSWADAVGGLRLRHRITDAWHVSLGGDVGGGGSDLTWMTYGALQFDFTRHVGLSVGYRVLGVEYTSGANSFDLREQGLVLGLRLGL